MVCSWVAHTAGGREDVSRWRSITLWAAGDKLGVDMAVLFVFCPSVSWMEVSNLSAIETNYLCAMSRDIYPAGLKGNNRHFDAGQLYTLVTTLITTLVSSYHSESLRIEYQRPTDSILCNSFLSQCSCFKRQKLALLYDLGRYCVIRPIEPSTADMYSKLWQGRPQCPREHLMTPVEESILRR